MCTKTACTVVIPCYNGEGFLNEAFESVMHQTFRDFHLVLVDDGSRDNTLALAHRLAEGRENVSVLEIPTNRGRCFARNLGSKANASPFVSFLDQDDTYHPDFLEVTVRTLREHPEIDAVRVLPNVSIELHPVYYQAVSVSLANTIVFRRTAIEFVGGWPESQVFRELAVGGEDIALRNLFTMLFREGALEAKLYNYRHRPGNALDLLLARSEIVDGHIVSRWGEDEDRTLGAEIVRLKEEFAERIRQFVYRNFHADQVPRNVTGQGEARVVR